MTRVIFGQDSVLQLKDSDFNTDKYTKITLEEQKCVLVFFYDSSDESINLSTLWALVAVQIAGPIFASINIDLYPEIKNSFYDIKTNPEHPYHSLLNQNVPFILVYRQGIPKALYNGGYNIASLSEYALVQSCQL